MLTQIPSKFIPIPLLSGSSIPDTSEYLIVTVETPSGKVSLAVPLLSAADSLLSLAVSVFPLIENVGLAFSESAVGLPTSEVTTILSFHPAVLESISVSRILRPLTGFVNVIVVVTSELPDPDLGSRLSPNVFTPPKAEFSIFGYPTSQSTSVFSVIFIEASVLVPCIMSLNVPSKLPPVHVHGPLPQSEVVHNSVAPVEPVPLSPASISVQVFALSFDTCQ